MSSIQENNKQLTNALNKFILREFESCLNICNDAIVDLSNDIVLHESSTSIENFVKLAIQALAELNRWREVLAYISSIYNGVETCPADIIKLCVCLYTEAQDITTSLAIANVWLKQTHNFSCSCFTTYENLNKDVAAIFFKELQLNSQIGDDNELVNKPTDNSINLNESILPASKIASKKIASKKRRSKAKSKKELECLPTKENTCSAIPGNKINGFNESLDLDVYHSKNHIELYTNAESVIPVNTFKDKYNVSFTSNIYDVSFLNNNNDTSTSDNKIETAYSLHSIKSLDNKLKDTPQSHEIKSPYLKEGYPLNINHLDTNGIIKLNDISTNNTEFNLHSCGNFDDNIEHHIDDDVDNYINHDKTNVNIISVSNIDNDGNSVKSKTNLDACTSILNINNESISEMGIDKMFTTESNLKKFDTTKSNIDAFKLAKSIEYNGTTESNILNMYATDTSYSTESNYVHICASKPNFEVYTTELNSDNNFTTEINCLNMCANEPQAFSTYINEEQINASFLRDCKEFNCKKRVYLSVVDICIRSIVIDGKQWHLIDDLLAASRGLTTDEKIKFELKVYELHEVYIRETAVCNFNTFIETENGSNNSINSNRIGFKVFYFLKEYLSPKAYLRLILMFLPLFIMFILKSGLLKRLLNFIRK